MLKHINKFSFKKMIIFCVLIFFIVGFNIYTTAEEKIEKEHYESETILKLNWGNGPDEIGFKKSPNPEESDIYIDGPTSFEVDSDDLIYILDAYHSRFVVFNEQGVLVRSFKVITDKFGGTDIDESDNLWIINGCNDTIHKYSTAGILKQTIKYYPHRSGYCESHIIFRKGEIFLVGFREKIQIDQLTALSGNNREHVYKAQKIEISKREEARNIGRISQRYYESPYAYEIGKKIIRVTEDNGDIKEVLISTDLSYTAVFLDEDSNGNSYFQIHSSKGFQIWKYNPDLELLAKIDIPPISVLENTQKWQNIDDEGNIFIMYLKSVTGIQIIKYSLIKNGD